MPEQPLQARSATLDDLKRLASELNNRNAKYILVGGYALHAAGLIRQTDDIDLLLPMSESNAELIIDALRWIPDSEADQLDPKWFTEPGAVRIVGEFVVDLLTEACGRRFEELQPYVKTVNVDGVRLATLDIDGLLLTKAGVRPKDVADRIVLEEAKARRRR